MDESGTDVAECHRKVASGRKVAGAIRSLVNVRGLQLELESALLYGSDLEIWRYMERSRIRVVQMEKLKRSVGIRRMDRVPNARIDEGGGG